MQARWAWHLACLLLSLKTTGCATVPVSWRDSTQQQPLRRQQQQQHGQTAFEPLDNDGDTWDVSIVRTHIETALATMQHEFFETWIGQWPTSIDWTGAVLGTHLSATLNTLSKFSRKAATENAVAVLNESYNLDEQLLEDQISGYFSQLQAYYFGEDAFAIRLQAHDDMLWVVLGWLEGIKFIDQHDARRHAGINHRKSWKNGHWHGKLFTPAFAHRAHVFFDLVSDHWDETLCGGGLTWNPHLEPYKNAVTNEQFISAAIGMYLYHPGDSNRAPFMRRAEASKADPGFLGNSDAQLPPAQPHNRLYLHMAEMAYSWLSGMNMTNARGLYVDGFHVRSYWDPTHRKRVYGACDLRNEMVYTYNQGILLSGQRQLWEGTGQRRYLQDGHTLIRSVIAATGWLKTHGAGWQGLGYNGILHDFCDPRGSCSQDGQTFKGIFFHHMSAFCEPLPVQGKDTRLLPGKSFLADHETAGLHANSCREYVAWLEHNAKAAWSTRNDRDVIGFWWGAPPVASKLKTADSEGSLGAMNNPLPNLPDGATDYRNENIKHSASNGGDVERRWDWNDRGRGRTVESHSGGLAVLRALYEMKMHYE